MNELTPFQRAAVAIALVKMFKQAYFDICTVDQVAKQLGVHAGGPDYQALRSMHCVHWSDMGPEMARQAKQKTLEVLGLNPDAVDIVAEAEAPRAQAAATVTPDVPRNGLARLLRLR